MSRIFISHSSKNNAEALALRDWLASQGWNDVFLDIDPERGLVAADRWQKALTSAIGRCRVIIFLLSPQWLASDHCISELDLAIHVGVERIGVIVKDIALDQIPTGLGGESQIINLTQGGSPLNFPVNPPPERKSIDVKFPEEDLRALRGGLARLGLVGFETESFPWPPPNEPDRAPYRGLEALDVIDAGVFFGRDSDLIRAREQLLGLRTVGGRKLFVIQGASGSGKSSFMRAGLLPRLQREDRDFVVLPIVRPQTTPISGGQGLAASLEKAFKELGNTKALGDLVRTLESSPDALPPLLNQIQVLAMGRLVGDAKPQINRPPTLVLAIDQAEELFIADGNQEAEKLRAHIAASIMRGPDTLCILTIRSDRFSLLQKDRHLEALLEPFNLPPLKSAVYRDAIIRPAARNNPPLEIDKHLVDTLIDDTVAEGADPMPLLAFTLERLYRRYGRSLHKMELAHYRALGGLAGSIDATIAEVLSEPQRNPPIPADRKQRDQLLESVFFPSLVEINEVNGEPLGRIATASEIQPAARNVIERLVNARLLVSDQAQPENDSEKLVTYRVAHEALLRHWGWIKIVLAEKAEVLSAAQNVERQALIWDRNGRSDDWLYHSGSRLSNAESLARREDFRSRFAGVPTEYLIACRETENLARSWRRIGRSFIAFSFLGLGAFSVIFLLGAIASEITLANAFGYIKQSIWQSVRLQPIFWELNAKPLNILAEESLKIKDSFRECDYCPEMVVLPAGSFMMGISLNDSHHNYSESPQHKVEIRRQFAVSKFEITFDQWDACYAHGGCSWKSDNGWGRRNRPVVGVSWVDANDYATWLSEITGKQYRLLSEAEWEYAARAGTTTNYSWGNSIGRGNANCARCGDVNRYKNQTVPVGSYKPNAFGLYDMHGNVSEWVADPSNFGYKGAPGDGSIWTKGDLNQRGQRGGSWRSSDLDTRSAARAWDSIEYGYDSGIRLARPLNSAR